MTSATVRPEGRATRPAEFDRPHVTRRGLLAWGLATSGLLLGSGALRLAMSGTGRPGDVKAVCPFPLESIPRTFDNWTYVPKSETHLDPLTVRTTGSTDHVIRGYYDEVTGTMLSVLILYGPAEPVLPHTPQVCYPSSGYRSTGEPVDRPIDIGDRPKAIFRSAGFAKSGGRVVIRQSVYHSFRFGGAWSPIVTDRSLPRRREGLFKVQIERRVQSGERLDGDEPIESFLKRLLPAMEQMIADATPARS